MSSPTLKVAVLLAATAVLGACGRVGALEIPGATASTADAVPPAVTNRGADPLPAGLTTSGALRSSTDTASTASSDNAPITKRDIQDPNQRLAPLSVQPVDGAPNPLGSPVSTRPPG